MESHQMSEDFSLMQFKANQLIAICDHLLNLEQYDKLNRFLASLPAACIHHEFKEHYHYILAKLFYLARNFDQVFSIIQTFTFSPSYHSRMQNIWFDCHYKTSAALKGKPSDAVERYRIRKKFLPPNTISNGERTTYNILESVSNKLCSVFDQIQYPNRQQKQLLTRDTGLSIEQIDNWFKNKRQRKKRMRKSPSPI